MAKGEVFLTGKLKAKLNYSRIRIITGGGADSDLKLCEDHPISRPEPHGVNCNFPCAGSISGGNIYCGLLNVECVGHI
jgi:hypothetical protein